MHVLLLGATGRTGRLVLKEAISRQYTVTVLVRRPEAVPTRTNLSIVKGTPLSKDDLANAFASAPSSDPITVVISTLNTGRSSHAPWARLTSPADIMAQSVRNALALMKKHRVKKIVVLGTRGVGSSRASLGWFFRFLIDHSSLKITFDDHSEVENTLHAEAEKDAYLEWVVVRAAGLSDGERKAVKEFGNEGKGIGMFISRDSVAQFILDAAESPRWDGQTPAISN